MKMIKRTLIAIAVVALLATSAPAQITEHYFPIGDHHAVKVDGKETVDFRWPYTVSYKALKVCNIPIKMQVGMYVQVEDCKNKKILLTQVPCTDLQDRGDGDFPCYNGCVKFRVRANFDVQLGHSMNASDTISDSRAYYVGDDWILGDGEYHEVELCVDAWKAKIWKAQYGDEIDVGSVDITVKPKT
jgi:hypothetical protein